LPLERHESLLVIEDLAASIVDVEVHLIANGKFLQNLAQLVQLVEESDPSAPVEVIGFDEPDIGPIVHLGSQGQLPTHLVLALSLMLVVIQDAVVDLLKLLVDGLRTLFQFHLLNAVIILAKSVDLVQKVLGREVQHELSRQILENISLGIFAILLHVYE
jgi:hypothetical protein